MPRIVGVDPGYRNLAISIIENGVLECCRHIDLGTLGRGDATEAECEMLEKLSWRIQEESFFAFADIVVIENQWIGKHATKNINIGLMYTISSLAHFYGARVILAHNSRRFSEFKFKRFSGDGGVKQCAVQLAMRQLPRHVSNVTADQIFTQKNVPHWEHLADSLLYAFIGVATMTGEQKALPELLSTAQVTMHATPATDQTSAEPASPSTCSTSCQSLSPDPCAPLP